MSYIILLKLDSSGQCYELVPTHTIESKWIDHTIDPNCIPFTRTDVIVNESTFSEDVSN